MDLLCVRRGEGLWVLGCAAILSLGASLRAEGPWSLDDGYAACAAVQALEKSRAALIEARRAIDEALEEVDGALALVKGAYGESRGDVVREPPPEIETPSFAVLDATRISEFFGSMWSRVEEAARRGVEAWKAKVLALRAAGATQPPAPEAEALESSLEPREVERASPAPAVVSEAAESVEPASATELGQAGAAESIDAAPGEAPAASAIEGPWWEPLWASEPPRAGEAGKPEEPPPEVERPAQREGEEPWWEPVPLPEGHRAPAYEEALPSRRQDETLEPRP